MIISLQHVNFDDNSWKMRSLNGIQSFLGHAYGLMYQSTFKKTKMFRRNNIGQKRFDSNNNHFQDYFVNIITLSKIGLYSQIYQENPLWESNPKM